MRPSARSLDALKLLVSIHAPWEGCDSPSFGPFKSLVCFNSRTLGRVRLYISAKSYTYLLFQFTHPGKGATCSALSNCYTKSVSIHAPWEGCDSIGISEVLLHLSFNSRTLGRVRLKHSRLGMLCVEFQFTHPGKGATLAALCGWLRPRRFNSRTLGRVRRCRQT